MVVQTTSVGYEACMLVHESRLGPMQIISTSGEVAPRTYWKSHRKTGPMRAGTSQTTEKMLGTHKRIRGRALPAHLLSMWMTFSLTTLCFATPTRLCQMDRGGLMCGSLMRDKTGDVRCKISKMVYFLLELTGQAKLMIGDACKNIRCLPQAV
jgi:hypothetical protein